MKPSEYVKLQNLSLKQRYSLPTSHRPQILEFVNPSERNRDFAVPIDDPLFRPTPSKIHLQNYEPFTTHELIINFRNMDKCTRKMRLEPLHNSTFELMSMRNDATLSAKVAAGMEISFKLKFTPKQDEDYSSQIVCVTEREKFIVPIEAVGTRAIIDMSDDITFENSSVHHENTKVVLIQNVGNRVAKIRFATEAPFAVKPDEATVGPQGNIQLTLTFRPETLTTFEKLLLVRLDSGETIHSRLIGTPMEQDIHLEYKELKLNPTYITTSSENRIKIINKSDVMAQFKWKYFSNEQEELNYRDSRKKQILGAFKKTNKIEDENRLAKAIDAIEMNSLLFENETFIVQPLEGIVWPKSCTEVQIIFKPSTVGVYHQIAFCDLSGRASRIPLTIVGEAMGPKATLSYEVLDTSEVFINHTARFEVTIENVGAIELQYALVETDSIFQSKFRFTPSSGRLAVGQKQILLIELCSNILGNYEEEFLFELVNSPDPLVLTIKGKIIGPTFRFDCDRIDYKTIPFNFPVGKRVNLLNTSQIEMDYRLRIENDKNELFAIYEDSGTLKPMESADVLVEFTPKSIGIHKWNLVVDIPSVGNDVFKLPIIANVAVSKVVDNMFPCTDIKVSVSSVIIDYRSCFINIPYMKSIQLINESNLPARIYIPEQSEDSKNLYLLQCNVCEEVIPPHSKLPVMFECTAIKPGHLNISVEIFVDGIEKPNVISLIGDIKGPVVEVQCKELCWKKIPVLTEKVLDFLVENKSPIEATIETELTKRSGVFRVDPPMAKIDANSVFKFKVCAYLDDCLQFEDLLSLCVRETNAVKIIQLSARGFGSTLVFEETSEPKSDFGNVQCSRPSVKQWKVWNKSRRVQHISWMRQGKHQPVKDWIFSFITPRFTLKPGEEATCQLVANCRETGIKEEQYKCTVSFDNQPVKKEVLKLNVRANFVEPTVLISKDCLRFIVSSNIDGSVESETKSLLVKNVTGIPIKVDAKCSLPFSVEWNASELAIEEEREMSITLHPQFYQQRNIIKESRLLSISYSDFPKKQTISLEACISFPNLSVEPSMVDFGYCEPGQRLSRCLTLKNIGDKSVEFIWYHSEGYSNCFQVKPWNGIIKSGEEMAIILSFCPREEGSHEFGLICRVSGGPDYSVQVKAQCNKIVYKLRGNEMLEFGEINYNSIVKKTFAVENKGLAPFQLETITCKHLLVTEPSNIQIQPGSSQEIKVYFCPGTVGAIEGQFTLQAGISRLPIKYSAVGVVKFPSAQLPFNFTCSPIPEKNANLNELIRNLQILTDERLRINPQTERNAFEDLTCALTNKISALADEKNIPDLFRMKITAANKKLAFLKTLANFSIHEYVCDFGSVLVDSEINNKVVIDNVDWNNAKDVSSGDSSEFSYEPFYNNNGEQIGLVISVDTSKSQDLISSLEFEMPDKPRLVIKCIAQIVEPKFSLSVNTIDFGQVLIGHRKRMEMKLKNLSTVTIQISARVFSESIPVTKKKNSPPFKFDLIGQKFILPNQELSLKVFFEPLREQSFDYRLCITSGKVESIVQLSGMGKQVAFDIIPSKIESPILLPFGDVYEHKIAIKNNNDFPIEVFPPDFDQQFQEEKEIVDRSGGFLYLQVRFPGQNLKQLLDNQSVHQLPTIQASVTTFEQPSPNTIPFIVVYGPPLSGKSTLAKSLSESYKLPLIQDFEEKTHLIPNDLIEQALELGLSEFPQGFILDGIPLRFPLIKFLTALQKFIGNNSSLHLLVLSCSINSLKARLQEFQLREREMINAITKLTAMIDEDDYEHNLTESQRQIFLQAQKCAKLKRSMLRQKYSTKMPIVREKEKNMTGGGEKKKKPPIATRKRGKTVGAEKSTVSLLISPNNHDSPIADNQKDTSNGSNSELMSPFDRLYDQYQTHIQPLIFMALEGRSHVKGSGVLKKKTSRSISTSNNSGMNMNTSSVVNNDILLQSFDMGQELSQEVTTPVSFFELNGDFTAEYLSQFCKELIPLGGSRVYVRRSSSISEEVTQDLSTKEYNNIIIEQRFEYKRGDLTNNSMFTVEAAEDELTSYNSSAEIIQPSKPGKLNVNPPKPPKESVNINRTVIAPGELRSFIIKFTPGKPGTVTKEIRFQTTTSNMTTKVVSCKYNCVYPSVEVLNRDQIALDIFKQQYLLDFGQVKVKEKASANKPTRTIRLRATNEHKIKATLTLKNDLKNEFFSVEPQTFELDRNGGEIDIQVSINPKVGGISEDLILLMLKDNPEITVFQVRFTGIIPQLEIEPSSTIQFERLMLQRQAKKTLLFRNKYEVPIYWKIVSDIPEEFAIQPRSGILNPLSQHPLEIQFCSAKALVMKKNVRVDFSTDKQDFEENVDLQSETFHVQAEAYDVLLDIHLPRGNESGIIDFGSVKVGEEVKLQITLKNKGKYDVGFRFESTLGPLLSISPLSGVITPVEKPLIIQLSLKLVKETNFNISQSTAQHLKCLIVEPRNNEVVGQIPVKIMAKSETINATSQP